MSSYRIPISRPSIGEGEVAAVADALRSGRLTEGPRLATFEDAFAEFCGASHAVAVSSGTSALQLALAAHGLGPTDEVIVPSFTFAATAAAVQLAGASPVFADIDPKTWCLDPQSVEHAIGPRTAAVVAVHLFGHPADIAAIRAVGQRHGLAVLEDAAQAHGAATPEAMVGGTGTACFSFHASKNMTTAGEGGLVCTDDRELAAAIRSLRSHGFEGAAGARPTGNHRMTEVAAACGSVQLRALSAGNARRAALAARYDATLRWVDPPTVAEGVTHAWHKYTVSVPGEARDALCEKLQREGVEARVYYALPLHSQERFAACRRADDLAATDRAARSVLSLPLHPGLTDAELDVVAELVGAFG